MPDDRPQRPQLSFSELVEAFKRAAEPVLERANEAHVVATECQGTLRELVGRDGDGGAVARLKADVAEASELARQNQLELVAFRRSIRLTSGIGATIGGGTVAAIIEAVLRLS